MTHGQVKAVSFRAGDMTRARDAVLSCTECGLCERVQDEGCRCEAGMWGPFADNLVGQVRRGAIEEDVERILFTCSLCGACTVRCPVGIDGANVAREGRAAFHGLNPEAAQMWRPMQTDLAGNVFTGLRQWRGIEYCDALAPGGDLVRDPQPCESLFFPGCTLVTYAPELTTVVSDFLVDAGLAHGMTALCCGNPLWGIGLANRCNAYAAGLNERFARVGVRRIVAGCPNCYRAFVQALDAGLIDSRIEVRALPQVLADAGVRISSERAIAPEAQSFSVFDSCPDRESGVFGAAVRAMLPEGPVRELRHAGKETFCCGSGGMVSYYEPRVSRQRRADRLAEFAECGADCLVTSCVSCANSFLRADGSAEVRHYLELAFGVEIDWEAHGGAAQSLAKAGGYDFVQEGDNEPVFG